MRHSLARPRATAIAAALLALLATGGCVGQRLYRPESVLHRDGYDLALVELDDQGELWSNAQVLAADRLIRDAGASERRALSRGRVATVDPAPAGGLTRARRRPTMMTTTAT